ncbi:hypothetical protein [Candidatus Arsenophonus triatominarum]|uniref:hypothetical protein n=1 Tax=Candidatus Arsenophonus triatominarum TaxID=57911 RepID=UPI000A6E1F1E|nr:hypothetical protein [Candidatus Arsenophonus triatominarum]
MKQTKKKEKTLKPSLPNAGIQLWYQRELRRQITRMHKNVTAKILTSFQKFSCLRRQPRLNDKEYAPRAFCPLGKEIHWPYPTIWQNLR